MPFQPLPENLEELIGALTKTEAPFVLDLGCGEGHLGHILKQKGVSCWGLDRISPRMGTGANIVGDALRPPILAGKVDLILAGNLVRHLLMVDKSGAFVGTWAKLLRPGGWLFILEDSPIAHSAAQENYRSLQEWLRMIVGQSRGPLLSQKEFLQLDGAQLASGQWNLGLKANTWPADAKKVIDMLIGDGGPPDPKVEQLRTAVASTGQDYGNYWWAGWQ